MKNKKKLNKIIFQNKNIDIHKTGSPICETQVSKLVFIKIPCLKFWALSPKFKRVSLINQFWNLGFTNGVR